MSSLIADLDREIAVVGGILESDDATVTTEWKNALNEYRSEFDILRHRLPGRQSAAIQYIAERELAMTLRHLTQLLKEKLQAA